MVFSAEDNDRLQKLAEDSPEYRELIQKLMDYHHFTLSRLNHEIRNPLTLISSTLQLIEAQHPETQNFRHWDSVKEDLQFLTQLLGELSDYNNGELLHTTRFSSYDFFGHVCLSFAASCADTEIEFTSRLASSLPDITGDQVKLREVFLNLLQNAKDAVRSKGRIRLDAAADSHFIKISVSDNGCGIPAGHLDDIFDAFVTYKTGGTGLGLAIAKRVVLAHKGTISVESEPGKGTTFLVVLPIA